VVGNMDGGVAGGRENGVQCKSGGLGTVTLGMSS